LQIYRILSKAFHDSASGRGAQFGQNLKWGLELAADDINALGGAAVAGKKYVVERTFEIIQENHRRSTTVLPVEQNASIVLTTAGRGYIPENGRTILE